ncbi:MAG: hypothetical protein V1715_13270 [bacterium]
MKEFILNNAEAQMVDRYAIDTLGIPGIELMQRAGSFISMKAKKNSETCTRQSCGYILWSR